MYTHPTPAQCKYAVCNSDPCIGLHDPFVCRVVPAALRFLSQLKEQESGDKLLQPALLEVLLTRALKYSVVFEQVNLLEDYCEFVAFNYIDFFSCIHRNEVPDFAPLTEYARFMLPFDQLMTLIRAQQA